MCKCKICSDERGWRNAVDNFYRHLEEYNAFHHADHILYLNELKKALDRLAEYSFYYECGNGFEMKRYLFLYDDWQLLDRNTYQMYKPTWKNLDFSYCPRCGRKLH